MAAETDTVVRLATSFWSDARGMYLKRSITILKRKSGPYPFLDEEIYSVGAREMFERIVNLLESPDGVYSVVTCNEELDWETGALDDWDYRLEPYEEDV